MSGPPPPPPPPGPPPPPAMAPPQVSKSEQHGRSALLTDISKGAKLKSAKHLMNDRSGLQTGKAGPGAGSNRPAMPPGGENGRITPGRGGAASAASNKSEVICYPVPAPRSITIGYSNSFSGVGSTTRHPPSVPQRPTAPHHHQSPGASVTIQHSRSLREKPLGPPPPPPPLSCSSSSSPWSPASSSSSLHNGGRLPPAGGGGPSGAGTVRNAPPGLGDLFGGGIPKLRGAGSNTVGRSVGRGGSDRVSNGSIDSFPPPPPPNHKPSTDFSDGAPSTIGRSSGSRSSGGFPPPPSPTQLSRPLPSVPGPRPSGPPPPPTRAPPPPRAHLNGSASQGYANRALPQTPGFPPKPPDRKDSAPTLPGVGPPPPPVRTTPSVPPPPPSRLPLAHVPPPMRPPGGSIGRSGPPTGPPPPPGPIRATSAPPPPPPGRPPVSASVSRTNSMASSASEFEAMFHFPTDLPHPDPFTPSNKTYPSQNPNRKASTNSNRRPVPPPPPPGGP